MILLYIFLGLILIGGYLIYKYNYDFKGHGWIYGYLMFSSVVSLFLYFMISMILFSILAKPAIDIECNIISMTRQTDLEGSFVLGTGSIHNVRYYIYRVQYSDGGIREYTAPIHQTTLYETDDTPKMVRYMWAMSRNITLMRRPNEQYEYKFYVPRGCVVKEFNIN